MKFTPKSETEIQEAADERLASYLWEKGDYDFEVLDCSDEVSKKGNEMIKLMLKVYNNDGKTQNVFDYLLESMEHKLRHAAYAVGLGERYEAGDLEAADFEGKSGKLTLDIQPAKDGYGAKNVAKDYVVSDEAQAKRSAAKTSRVVHEDLDDEIPF